MFLFQSRRYLASLALYLLLGGCSATAQEASQQDTAPSSQKSEKIYDLQFDDPQWKQERQQRTTPQLDDLITLVTVGGEPVKGLQVQLFINKSGGFFTGSGVSPESARTLSDENGEARFADAESIRERVEQEIYWIRESGHNAEAVTPRLNRTIEEEVDSFSGFRWQLKGYWPKENCRIHFLSQAQPRLWFQGQEEDQVRLKIPMLSHAVVRVLDKEAGQPLVQVRAGLQNRGMAREHDWTIYAYSWTNTDGIAQFWVPEGDYSFVFSSMVAHIGDSTKQEKVKNIEVPVFGAFDGRHPMGSERQRRYEFAAGNTFPEMEPIRVRPNKNQFTMIQEVRIPAPEKIAP